MPLIAHVSSLLSISRPLEAALQDAFLPVSVAKSQTVVQAGNRCNDLFFVDKGILRGCYLEDGKEITSWFAQENEFATCFYAFIGNGASTETIHALEDTVLLKISAETLQDLYMRFPETERIGRLVTETYYMKLEERLLNIRFRTAKERYTNLVDTRPQLLQRASLGQIASYLGITQETLSRIRAEG